MIVTCDKCKEEVQVNMYLYDASIGKNIVAFSCTEYWEARCRGKAICPCCGVEIHKYYARPIETSDIIELATWTVGGRE